MEKLNSKNGKDKTEQSISSISSQSNIPKDGAAYALNPYADLLLPDGRRFRFSELRIYEANTPNTCPANSSLTEYDRRTYGNAPRWFVEMEVQSDGRGDNFAFKINITWEAIRNGELERVGYRRYCDRPTAILLIARECVWQHLYEYGHPSRFSSHARSIHLEAGASKNNEKQT